MPRRIEDQRVYQRYRNGACVMDRTCKICGQIFCGDRNTCPECLKRIRRQSGKFGAEYHRNYYQKKLSKTALLRTEGDLTKEGPIADLRRAAWEKQRDRIWAELAAGAE